MFDSLKSKPVIPAGSGMIQFWRDLERAAENMGLDRLPGRAD
jgi:hypothetical protein